MGLLLTLAIACADARQEASAEDRFQRGRQFIEANCGDCMGSTRAGLEQGIGEVSKALELGYPDRLAAHRLLAGAYNTLALVFAQPDSKEQKAAFEERRQVYEKILALDPSDVETRYLYATSLRDKAQKMTQLRKVLELQPDHADARFAVGVLLVEDGRTDDGLIELRKAFDLSGGARAEAYGTRLMQILTALGRKQEAEDIAKKLAEKLKTNKRPLGRNSGSSGAAAHLKRT